MKRLQPWVLISIAVVLLAGCTWGAGLPAPLPPVDVASYPGNDVQPLLVSATWLAAQQTSNLDSVVILDASPLMVYRGGHIRGAVHAWWQDAMDPNAGVYGTVLKPDENAPDPQRLRRNLIEDLGVSPDVQVVIYDDAGNRDASRLLWTLRFLGYPNSALLDGGLAAWRGIDGKLETSENDPRSISKPLVSPQQDRYLWKRQVVDRLDDPTILLVDVRTDEERQDDIDGTIEPGSIPGSIPISWETMLDPTTGRLLEPNVLQALFVSAGISQDRTILLYGRFGLESAFTWFVLNLLDYPKVLIYDGGWAEWAQDPTTPKVLLDAI